MPEVTPSRPPESSPPPIGTTGVLGGAILDGIKEREGETVEEDLLLGKVLGVLGLLTNRDEGLKDGEVDGTREASSEGDEDI